MGTYCTGLGVFVFGFVCLFDNTTRAVRRMTDAIELTDVRFFGQDGAERTPASVSYQLAHEVARLLELRGNFVRASQVLAVALAEAPFPPSSARHGQSRLHLKGL